MVVDGELVVKLEDICTVVVDLPPVELVVTSDVVVKSEGCPLDVLFGTASVNVVAFGEPGEDSEVADAVEYLIDVD